MLSVALTGNVASGKSTVADLWVEEGVPDSLQKMAGLLAICQRLGVETRSAAAAGLQVVPLYSWYETGFGGEAGAEQPKGWADKRYCRWPPGLGPVARYMDGLNQDEAVGGDVLSFSHFVPRLDLLLDDGPDTDVSRYEAGCAAGIDAELWTMPGAPHIPGINTDFSRSVLDWFLRHRK